jgi:hypothetical protein
MASLWLYADILDELRPFGGFGPHPPGRPLPLRHHVSGFAISLAGELLGVRAATRSAARRRSGPSFAAPAGLGVVLGSMMASRGPRQRRGIRARGARSCVAEAAAVYIKCNGIVIKRYGAPE